MLYLVKYILRMFVFVAIVCYGYITYTVCLCHGVLSLVKHALRMLVYVAIVLYGYITI